MWRPVERGRRKRRTCCRNGNEARVREDSFQGHTSTLQKELGGAKGWLSLPGRWDVGGGRSRRTRTTTRWTKPPRQGCPEVFRNKEEWARGPTDEVVKLSQNAKTMDVFLKSDTVTSVDVPRNAQYLRKLSTDLHSFTHVQPR